MQSQSQQYTKDELLAMDKDAVWHHMTQHGTQTAPMMVRGQGSDVWDVHGNQYLDASSGGVWCVNVGYGRESIAEAVKAQLVSLNYFAGTAATPVAAQFASKLLDLMPGMGKVYFSNSGSEANEKAYKIVRQIAAKKYGGKKHKILYRERDYHGTTITCLSSTGQEERRNQYGPFTPGFIEFPHCCEYRSQFGPVDNYGELAAKAFEDVILREGPDTVGAVVIEPITAGGGVITPPEGYLLAVQAICQKYDILLHVDEVVCGMGRTGAWFGYQHYGIQPDIVTMAKGVASAYAAISCTVVTDEVFDLFADEPLEKESFFRDISTFGGCTAGPAAALENLRIIEQENLVENAAHMGEYLRAQLQGLQSRYPIIGDVRGKGLFLGLELVEDPVTRQPVDETIAMQVVGLCAQHGVLIGRTNRSFRDYNNTLCLSPMLTLTKDEADRIVEALDSAFSALIR
ncbi:aspartate aminotransferase family protein [Photobacterium sp. DNB23_23_1]|uniref:Aminotransferase class III-fold pyridoxal phosphate-dependent enzyme n=1 Tax=Photobacterium pectinilyticum TaxID=2906793 RepID=A0ABT1N4X4_9GAMM|nr:aminotransferase class III-fold pyridoxal phosphate-dependent enzyme [Photobacterium sp. ZSDE20]MCQ1059795.1 aminotransferase class III-fold pyridoxal phosphate-dependent enzyme [Photobacterium sp. ZSDE20]MDD1826148.1 aminotransferase class III-fold pyridoxal phosphate-dependent enzyme [Photobacterium sp. ZSDE20]